jgi:hypothetical protein
MRTLFEQEAVAAAEEYGLRERTIPLAKLLYVLVLGCWQQPSAGPSALARFAGSLGLDVCKQDLERHFTERTALWLLAVLRRAVQLLVCAKPVELALFRPRDAQRDSSKEAENKKCVRSTCRQDEGKRGTKREKRKEASIWCSKKYGPSET